MIFAHFEEVNFPLKPSNHRNSCARKNTTPARVNSQNETKKNQPWITPINPDKRNGSFWRVHPQARLCVDLPKTPARPVRRACPVPPKQVFREHWCVSRFLSHDFAFKKSPIRLLHAKPVGYSSRDFAYYKGTPTDCLNKKTAHPSWRTDDLKMPGPQFAKLREEYTGTATRV
jgi:hypothetical protein